jgi:ABC-type branched-subunit amino acid transport system substrate-binding protein
MDFSIFVAARRGQRFFTQTAKLATFGCILLGLAGCLVDQRLGDGTPRDLLPESSVQSDRLPTSGGATVALLLPLSGTNAESGQQLWDGAVMALFESGRDDVALLPFNTQGTPVGAGKAAEAAVKAGANVVIGPLFSTSVIAARPVLAAAGIRGIALSNNQAAASPSFFLIGNQPETQVDALSTYLTNSNRRRIVLVGPDTLYLQLLHERLALLDKAGKIELVDTRLYRPNASYTEIAKDVRAITLYDQRVKALRDFAAIFSDSWRSNEDPEKALESALERFSQRIETARLQIAAYPTGNVPKNKGWTVTETEYSNALSDLLQIYHKQLGIKKTPRDAMDSAVAEFQLRETLGQVNFDAVLLPVGGEPLLVIAPMFEYFNASQPDVWLLGTEVWEAPSPPTAKDLLGSRYVTTTSAGWVDFKGRFEKTFGQVPDRLTALAYDAVRVAITEKAETGHISFTGDFITRQAGFEGVNGRFRFLPGGVNVRTLDIVELQPNGAKTVFTWQPEQQLVGPQLPAPGIPITAPPTGPVSHPAPPVSSLDGAIGGKG